LETFNRQKIDLAGTWQIAFDPDDLGLKNDWVGRWPEGEARPVQVPGIWNLAYPDADGVGFYRTRFTVPTEWAGRALRLCFEGVIYRCEAWLNGRYAGGHEGGYTPFALDVSALARAGAPNDLVVRVAALSKKRPVDGMRLEHAPLSKQSWYYVYGGIWGEVALEARSQVVIEAVRIEPRLRREQAGVEIEIDNRRAAHRPVRLWMRVTGPRGEVVYDHADAVSALPGSTRFAYSLPIPAPLAWSCKQPNLYRLEAGVVDEDGETDGWGENFGMRDFTARDGRFFLNGEPLYIRGVLLQPNYPVTLIRHPDREMMEREIGLVKQAGFNLVRVHIQPAPPGYLDLADRLGILVYAETSLAWIRANPRLTDHGRRELRALIERDRNHPSVVFWGVYNENPQANRINGAELCRFARGLDPTRVVVDNSGGALAIDQDFGWIDRAALIPAFETQPQKVLDVHLYLGAPISRSLSGWLSSLGTGASSNAVFEEKLGSQAVLDEFDRECRAYSGQVFVSELGYGGMSDLEETVAGFQGQEDLLDARELKTLRDSLREGFRKRKLEQVFGSVKNLFQEAQDLHAAGNTQQIEALLVNPRVSGFIITQLNDVAWEFHAGLLDLWRNPKAAYYAALRLNRPHVLVLRPARRSAHPGELVSLELAVRSRDQGPPGTRLCVTVSGPLGQEVFSRETEIDLLAGIQLMPPLDVPLDGPGEYRVTARLLANGAALAETEETLLALEPVDWESLPARVALVGAAPGVVLNRLAGREAGGQAGPSISLVPQPGSLSEEQWEALLDTVAGGQAAVVGALQPEDQAALQALAGRGIVARLHFGIGSWMGCYHWLPASAITAGLPGGGIASLPYAEILPKYVLSELGGTVLAGSLRNTQSRLEAPAMLWYSDIELLRLGQGALLLCQYRAFSALERDPVAARLAYNILAAAGDLGSLAPPTDR
jgi:hypothetical protein